MKQVSFLILLSVMLAVSTSLEAQTLAELYKKGEIHLTTDPTYAAGADWSKVFYDFEHQDHGRSTGESKSIVVAPNGSVFVSHRTRHSISRFDPQGNYLSDFGKKGGKSPSDFIYMPSVQGVLDGKLVYTTAVDGRMHFFDLQGNWVKTLKLKYMPLNSIPLKGGKIALLGYVPYKNAQARIMISILTVADGKEKIIRSEFQPYAKEKTINIDPYFYKDENGKEQRIGNWISTSLPMTHPSFYRLRMDVTKSGNLVTANPSNGEVIIYDPSGKVLTQFTAELTAETITAEDREEYYQKALEGFKKMEQETESAEKQKEYWKHYLNQYRQQLGKFRDPANYPDKLPGFSELIIDSDDNLLLFRFTREKGSNQFDVFTFDSKGEKISTCRFVADNYQLKITPSTFQFHKGHIYALTKDATNVLQLVRFELK